MNKLTGLDELVAPEEDASVFICQNKSVVVQSAKARRSASSRHSVNSPLLADGEEQRWARPLAHSAAAAAAAKRATDSAASEQCLVFHEDGSMRLEAQLDFLAPTISKVEKEIPTYGIIGLLDLDCTKYLVHVSKARLVGALGPNHGTGKVWQIVEVSVLPVFRRHYITLSEVEYEKDSVRAIMSVGSSGLLHFSYDYDLTHTVQRNFDLRWPAPLSRLMKRSITPTAATDPPPSKQVFDEDPDDRFLWNRFLLEPLMLGLRNELQNFCVACICGHVSTSRVNTLESRVCDVSLVLRVNRRRAGTRFIKRGIDSQGNAACGAQTEQIVSSGDAIAAHAQARGSVPLMWDQMATKFSPSPPIHIHHQQRSTTSTAADPNVFALRRHAENMVAAYGPKITMLNLLDPTGWKEGPLSAAMRDAFAKFDNSGVKYLSIPLTRNSGSLRAVTKAAMEEVIHEHFFFATRVAVQRTPPSTVDASSSVSLQKKAARNRNGRNLVLRTTDAYNGGGVGSANKGKPLDVAAASGAGDTVTEGLLEGTAWRVGHRQSGVLRTNCLDCIDRTNIVQFRVGCEVMTLLLNAVGAFCGPVPPSPILSPRRAPPVFEDRRKHPALDPPSFAAVRAMWADLGNALAHQQTMTPTVGTLFVRKGGGARTLRSWLYDYRTRFSRWYANYFIDPARQTALDIFLGHCRLPIAAENAKYQQLIQKRLAMADSSKPWYIFFFLLAKRFFAPTRIDTTASFVMAVIWLMVTRVYLFLTRADADGLFRQPYSRFELLIPTDQSAIGGGGGAGAAAVGSGYVGSDGTPAAAAVTTDTVLAASSAIPVSPRIRGSSISGVPVDGLASATYDSDPGVASRYRWGRNGAVAARRWSSSGPAGPRRHLHQHHPSLDELEIMNPEAVPDRAQVEAKQEVVHDLQSRFFHPKASPIAALTKATSVFAPNPPSAAETSAVMSLSLASAAGAQAEGAEGGGAGSVAIAPSEGGDSGTAVVGDGGTATTTRARRKPAKFKAPSPPTPSPPANWPLTPPANLAYAHPHGPGASYFEPWLRSLATNSGDTESSVDSAEADSADTECEFTGRGEDGGGRGKHAGGHGVGSSQTSLSSATSAVSMESSAGPDRLTTSRGGSAQRGRGAKREGAPKESRKKKT